MNSAPTVKQLRVELTKNNKKIRELIDSNVLAKQIHAELVKSNKKIRELIDSIALNIFVLFLTDLQNEISKLYGILEKADKTGSIEEKVLRKIDEELYDIEANVERAEKAFWPNIKKYEAVFKECQNNFVKVYTFFNKLNDNLKKSKLK